MIVSKYKKKVLSFIKKIEPGEEQNYTPLDVTVFVEKQIKQGEYSMEGYYLDGWRGSRFFSIKVHKLRKNGDGHIYMEKESYFKLFVMKQFPGQSGNGR